MLRHRLPSFLPSFLPPPPWKPSLTCPPQKLARAAESNNILSSRRRRKSKSRLLRDERKEKGEREVKRRRSPIHPWLNNLSFQTDSTSSFLSSPSPSSSPSKPACRLSSSTCLPSKTPSISPSLFPLSSFRFFFLLSHFYPLPRRRSIQRKG